MLSKLDPKLEGNVKKVLKLHIFENNHICLHVYICEPENAKFPYDLLSYRQNVI